MNLRNVGVRKEFHGGFWSNYILPNPRLSLPSRMFGRTGGTPPPVFCLGHIPGHKSWVGRYRYIINLTYGKTSKMDKDRINGAANQAKGAIKETAGKMTGDTKLQTEGVLDKAKGKIESAVGGAKDTLRGK